MLFNATTFLVTFIAGIGTGLLGIGGALIIYPCFLFVLPMFIDINLSISQISGIAAMQILVGSFSGFLSHKKQQNIQIPKIYKTGIIACSGTFTGGVLSGTFSRELMLGLYLFTVVLAISSMSKKREEGCKACNNKTLMNIFIFLTGLFAGILGVGGAVLYIPILRYFMNISTKDAIPTVVFIVFAGAITTFLGKSISGQIIYSLLPIVFLGAFSGARIGAKICKKTSSKVLKALLLIILILTALRVSIELLI